ncbi:hypothetical protein HU200_058933 [Digitaria exilis]|uniref:Knottins-like domain-containing protein n=1 Tax=Digitaria exilis TaxID=1010633 RepID=A0A835DZT6_9POAL|nr:hypothetical protein HU200_058933 [Digitaria exilis]
MAPSAKNAPVVFLLLVVLPIIMAIGESAYIGDYSCGHLSGNYKGLCIEWIHDNDCKRVCIDESNNNVGGHCHVFEYWCESICTTKTVAAASAPTRQ